MAPKGKSEQSGAPGRLTGGTIVGVADGSRADVEEGEELEGVFGLGFDDSVEEVMLMIELLRPSAAQTLNEAIKQHQRWVQS